jgi:hypothetical protein
MLERWQKFRDEHAKSEPSEYIGDWIRQNQDEARRFEEAVKKNKKKILQSAKLEGKTFAKFEYTPKVVGRKVSRGAGCKGCSGKECVHVTGTLVVTYVAKTTVNLPRASDYPSLSACQRRILQEAIDRVIAPHEQEHVKVFHKYNGTTRRSISIDICKR